MILRRQTSRLVLDAGKRSAASVPHNLARGYNNDASSSSSLPQQQQQQQQQASRLRRLPPPKPSWSYRRADLKAGLANALERKATFTVQDHVELEAMRPRLEELIPERQRLATVQAELGTRVRQLIQAKTEEERGALRLASSRAKEVKEQVAKVAGEIDEINAISVRLRLKLPNTSHEDVPRGNEDQARIVATGGPSEALTNKSSEKDEGKQDILEKRFKNLANQLPLAKSQAQLDDVISPDRSRDHVLLLEGLLDSHASQLAAGGANWPFLRASLAKLEHALVQYALTTAVSQHGFSPCVVPDVIKRDILTRTGFAPRDGSGGQVYWLSVDGETGKAAESDSDLCLAATAEVPLAGLCAGQLFEGLTDQPIKLVAASHAFRAEAGARGLDSRGLYRVHQFTKVELFVVCTGAESDAMLETLRSIQERVVGQLGLAYRVLDMPTEELGASAYRKYDVEVWMPGRGQWGEVSSASNCTEYQARRLYIRHRANAASNEAYAHTLNATAVAVPRLIVALVENYGMTADGRLRLPDALKPFWLASPADAPSDVEWTSSSNSFHTESKDGRLKRAIASVRALAHRQGTDAPTMVVAFLVLHELTAILPIVILFYLFALFGVGEAIVRWFQEATEPERLGATSTSSKLVAWRQWCGEWLQEGIDRAERFGRRKGYFGFSKGETASEASNSHDTATVLAGSFANAVAAYAVVKALFPLRIAASVALAGPFARVCFEPGKRALLALRSRFIRKS